MIEGHLSNNGVVTKVWSITRKPRLPGDGCGCERDVRWGGWFKFDVEYVVRLCKKHGREPGIVEYMLP